MKCTGVAVRAKFETKRRWRQPGDGRRYAANRN